MASTKLMTEPTRLSSGDFVMDRTSYHKFIGRLLCVDGEWAWVHWTHQGYRTTVELRDLVKVVL